MIIQWLVLGCLRIITYAVFALSIFDIYYTSPIVHGMTPQKSSLQPPAKRLVLVSFDGLRASSMFEIHTGNKSNFPFVRNIVETRGAWGVVTNDGPTESRPSHIAMTCGIHEDPASIRHWWKKNPVAFDSLFNESRKTWAMGHRGVLNTFKNVITYRVTKDDVGDLGQFYEHTKGLLNQTKTNKSLKERLNEDKVIIFLHLDITDEIGHLYLGSLTNTTANGQYRKELLVIDKNLKKVVAMMEQFYNDTATAFVVTGDHGIAAHGAHGGKTDLERLVPLVAWGAGVRGPVRNKHGNRYDDNFSEAWNLSHLLRHDMDQIDMAPLLASLIGVNFPMNSEGLFRHEYLNLRFIEGLFRHEYLNLTPEERAEVVYAHTRQVLALVEMKLNGNNSHFLSTIFNLFMDPVLYRMDVFHGRIGYLRSKKRFHDIVNESSVVANTAIQWLRANHLSPDRLLLRLSVATGTIGWVAYILTFLIRDKTPTQFDKSNFSSSCCKRNLGNCWRCRKSIISAMIIFVVIYLGLQALTLPMRQCMYIMVTPLLWWFVYIRKGKLLQLFNRIRLVTNQRSAIFTAAMWIGLVQLAVYTFLSRKVLTTGFIVLAISAYNIYCWTHNKRLLVMWSALCVLLAVFPQLPIPKYPDETDKRFQLVTGIGVCLTTFLVLLRTICKKPHACSKRNTIVNIIQIAILAISTYISDHPVTKSTESAVRILSCVISGVSPLWPFLVTTDIGTRLRTLFLSLISTFMLLSKSWDVLFITCLCLLLCVWLRLEDSYSIKETLHGVSSTLQDNKLPNGDSPGGSMVECNITRGQPIQTRSASRTVCFIFILFASFFGRESIASSVMFYRIPFDRFIPKSQTLTGNILLVVKNITPAVYALCVLEAIHRKTQFSRRQFILTTIIIGDIMSLQTLFHFHETGTWFELGTVSIVQYGAPTGLVLVLLLLQPITHALMTLQVKPILAVLWIGTSTRNTVVKLCTIKNLKLVLLGVASIIVKVVTSPVYCRICLVRIFNSRVMKCVRSVSLLRH